MKHVMMFLWRLPRNMSRGVIRMYQRTLSLDHGPMKKFFPYGYCKFHPSCSQYGHDALGKYGFIGGWLKALWRILRCNPLTQGGNDPA